MDEEWYRCRIKHRVDTVQVMVKWLAVQSQMFNTNWFFD